MRRCIRAPAARLAAAAVGGLALVAPASAGVISGFTVQTNGNGTTSVFVNTTAANNDNVTTIGNNNIDVNGKNFTSVGPIDIVFDVTATGGTTEYLVAEGVTNSTGVTWTGYQLQLGFGFGANFVPSGADGLDFDTPDRDPTPTHTAFSSLVHLDDLMIFGGGSVPNLQADAIGLSIDVPDGITQFTLRQVPLAVPEPGGLALAGAAALGLLRRRRA